ncbi:hypothetical protein CH63R_01778 [Colletotrichum higginsianum IMI 349063]|uniref:Uncharacterized protein n=1 Tax=Colletotrichum higginsianum (strain IMI 349063) TaxID=759273 RepID=A0A1B7YM84_COLHI|nr:hypothetical protein CH63R_01778 [Colletotrichum higginsianum IMI 349063]OBR13052.1 hypothetical protein CH63R_01778 [Colletotrichum higginsianum IMI 349063]
MSAEHNPDDTSRDADDAASLDHGLWRDEEDVGEDDEDARGPARPSQRWAVQHSTGHHRLRGKHPGRRARAAAG